MAEIKSKPAGGGKLDTLNGLDTLSTVFFYLSILTFIIGFNFSDNRAGGWTQQFMPSGLPNFQVSDIFFLDSLTGWAVTGNSSPNDSSGYILKTTNGGNNWILKFAEYRDFSRVKFINAATGFVSGGYFNGAKLYKTTNGGDNWFNIYNLAQIYLSDMAVLNNDTTIWVTNPNSLEGGVYRTTNGGASWEPQLNLGSSNPDHIYMFNGRIGFISKTNSYTRRTSDGGLNWTPVLNGSGQGFYDMYFADSLTGWGTFSNTRKTTDGGLNWIVQVMPDGGNIVAPQIEKLSGLNKDTIYGVGAQILTGIGIRGMVNRTTNGGVNWLFQSPDSTFNANKYSYIDFYNKLIGWAYLTVPRGIHTTSGGDPIFYTTIKQISTNIPDGFKLEQNYPNPFNPITNFKLRITNSSNIQINVYDVNGKLITILINEQMQAGEYVITFDGTNYSSGIYFYSLIVDGKLVDTKRMVLIK